MSYAPIALFTYNRANHTRQAVESLLQNEEAKESDLYIFSDGPKTPEKAEGVRLNREYIHTIKGFKSVTIIERKKNWGLAKSLIAGITELTDKFGRVIVVEDDLILSPFFLKFMNDGLNKYQDDDRICAISSFLTPTDVSLNKNFFLRYFDCWGWATWKRAWKLLNTDTKYLLKQIRWKKSEFDIGNAGGFYGMLYCQKIGIVDSWAVRFYASCFIKNKLVLYPHKTLAIQNGFDGSGIHCNNKNTLYAGMTVSKEPVQVSDILIEESKQMYKAYHRAYMQELKPYYFKHIYSLFKSFIRRLIGLDYK